MRGLLYILSAVAVMGLAMWAYQQNHLTHVALQEARELRREIRGLRESLAVQRAEWAYLNRPDRLRALVDMNFQRLGLLPMTGAQFGEIGDIALTMPPPRSVETRP